MRVFILKLILFVLLLIGLFFLNLWVFRSDYPLLWLGTALLSSLIIICFPYNLYFNNKNK